MRYVVVEQRDRGVFWHDPSAYLAALPHIAEDLPAGARAHASDPGHYDFYAERCVKDLKLTALPPTSPTPSAFDLRLLCCRGEDEHGLTLRYSGVTEASVAADDGGPFELTDFNSLRLDEVLPHEQGCSHELRFTLGTLHIVCADFEAIWDPAPLPR
ncbi:hypothetical protein [Streptomyces aculeolatus]|uniref:hypothetical protein n=1 Tax=Streptomyces aculeolatus TaxID=270689 RepID=UPI001CECC2C9|nr:hypothetical protein [Streptomyces aculeolatus]